MRFKKTPIPQELRWEVLQRDDFTCQKCGERKFLHVDHIIPESAEGLTVAVNLQTLCKSCNSRKGKKHPGLEALCEWLGATTPTQKFFVQRAYFGDQF